MPLPETLLSVLIVNFNTRLLTCQCLRSLLPEARTLGAQVIVVDNGSTDGSLEAIGAEFPEVEVMALDGNLGFGAANNRAAARSAARYLLLLNSDTIVHTGALQALIDCANMYSDAGAVGARLLNADGSLQLSCWRFPTLWRATAETFGLLRLIGRPSNYRPADYDTVRRVDFAIGACLLVDRQAFVQVGGFDEAFFMYAEETDLCRRLRAIGKYVYYTPASVVTHLGGGSKLSSADQFRQFNAATELYFSKHYGAGVVASYRVVCALRALLRLILWSGLCLVHPRSRPRLRGRLNHSYRLLRWQFTAWRRGH
jgi:GT2 family glycosyltransferase